MKVPLQQKKKSLPPVTQSMKRAGVSYRMPDPFAHTEQQDTVQREVVKCGHKNDEYKGIALHYEKALDSAVDQAHKHVLSAPRLGISIDGHTDKWVEDWNDYMQNKNVDLFAASFGYAIESLATNVYLPPAPTGFNIELQGIRESTRPDVILKEKGKDIAWLDITASNSKGHIWKKGPPFWSKQNHTSEIAYPSLDGGALNFMRKNDKNDKPVHFNPKAFEEQLEMARKLSKIREQRWEKTGTEVLEEWKNKKLKKGSTAPKLTYQTPMMKILYTYFGLDFTDQIATYDGELFYSDQHVDYNESGEAAALRKELPHILTALGIGTKQFGLVGGSRNRGRAWLMQYDTQMPQLSDLMDKNDSTKVNDTDVTMIDKTK